MDPRERGSLLIPFYPACNFELVGELDVADAPIWEFHGTADNWILAAPCRDNINRLAAAGHDAVMTEYPGASHAFDHTGSPSSNIVADAQMARNCRRREDNGRIVNAETGTPFTYQDACGGLGPAAPYIGRASDAAPVTVKRFLTKILRLANWRASRLPTRHNSDPISYLPGIWWRLLPNAVLNHPDHAIEPGDSTTREPA